MANTKNRTANTFVNSAIQNGQGGPAVYSQDVSLSDINSEKFGDLTLTALVSKLEGLQVNGCEADSNLHVTLNYEGANDTWNGRELNEVLTYILDNLGNGGTAPVEPSVVDVEGITISPSSFTLNGIGATRTLTANVTPTNASDRTVTWSSSNTNVATVNTGGKVTAVNAGNATITATSNSNNNVSGTASVTVNNVITPTSISASIDSAGTIRVGESYTLSATVSPSNAEYNVNDIKWYINNTQKASGNNVLYTFVDEDATSSTVKIQAKLGTLTSNEITKDITGQNTNYYWFVGKDGDEVPFNANDIKPSDSEEAGWRMESSKPSQIHPEVFDLTDFKSKWCVIVPTEWNFVACDTGGNPEPGGWDQAQITVNGINYTKWVTPGAYGGVNAVFK